MKNLKSVIFWGGVFITILTIILVKPLSNLDEIWNFNIARCISNGLIPYKDISLVTTPLVGFITAIFLKIFGTEMFVTRILAAILALINLILIYRIFKKIEIPKSINMILILIIAFIFKDYFCLDYNFFILMITLIIILLEIRAIKKEKNDIKIQIIIGIFAGLAFCTKQSIGVLICFFTFINLLFFIKQKNDSSKIFKNMLFRALGIIIPIIVFFIYLISTDSLNGFIDYCISGIKTFSNKISYNHLMSSQTLLIKILSICAPIILIICTIINIVTKCLKKEDKVFYLLNIYSIPIFTMIFPIADNIHFLIGIVPIFILLVWILQFFIKKYIKISGKYIFEFFEIASMLAIIMFTIYIEVKNGETLGNLSKYSKINNFKYIYISDSFMNSIEELGNYIQSSDKQVYILDASSAVYMIPINKYNKNYDMFNKGNFGSGGEDSQIEKIKNENAKYLIRSDNYSTNWQNPEKITNYVKENFEKIGNIGIYDIYENTKINQENIQTDLPENTIIQNEVPQN